MRVETSTVNKGQMSVPWDTLAIKKKRKTGKKKKGKERKIKKRLSIHGGVCEVAQIDHR